MKNDMGVLLLWLGRKLAEMQIFKTSFSKYGLAYQDIFKNGGLKYA